MSEKQLTGRGLLLGLAGLLVITTSSMYVALRMGALPWPTVFVTVLSMSVLGKRKNSSLQEINVTHTLMSSGAMVAGGLAFTIPGIWIIDPDYSIGFLPIAVMTVCGAILGTLFSALFRKNLLEEQKLVFPIGNAAYNTLTTGINSGKKSLKLFLSMGFSVIFTALRDLWAIIPSVLTVFNGGVSVAPISVWLSPMGMAIGAMIGKLSAFLWLAGAIFGYLILCPVGIGLGWFEDLSLASLFRENLGIGLLIGCGIGVFVRGAITIAKNAKSSSKDGRKGSANGSSSKILIAVFVGVFASVLLMVGTELTLLQALLAVAGVCLTTLLSGMLTGQSGVNPMEIFGILVLLLVQVVFSPSLMALFAVACTVSVACGLSGDVMNDLKSGYMLKTDPKQQLLAEGIGGVFGALISVAALFAMKKAFGGFGTDFLPAPQAKAVASMASGLGHSPAFFIGIAVGLAFQSFGLSIATFGLGIYLPSYISFVIGIGAIAGFVSKKIFKVSIDDVNLVSSGLLGGEGVAGVIIAIISMFG